MDSSARYVEVCDLPYCSEPDLFYRLRIEAGLRIRELRENACRLFKKQNDQLSIAAFVLRLICTNGMISKTEVSGSYRHVSLKILNEFPKVLDNVSLELGKQRDQFRISIESKVDNPLATLESFNRQFQIGEKENEAVKWGWEQEMGNTMFHVVNAYTRAAQFEGLPAEASYRLQKVGGMVLGMVK
jgi:hypothetical protein